MREPHHANSARGRRGGDEPEANSASGSDPNSGTQEQPFATIQKAIDKVLEFNNDTREYTIYVSGTVTPGATTPSKGMADFSALNKNLTLTIKALSTTATLDAGARFSVDGSGTVSETNAGIGKSVIYANPSSVITLDLTLENLVITGGNANYGGGVYANGVTLTMKGCEIGGNRAKTSGGGVYVGGTIKMQGGKISDNAGGGLLLASGTFTMEDNAEINSNKKNDYGAGVFIVVGTLTLKSGSISYNNAYSNDGGVFVYGTFTMNNGMISGNEATYGGGGVCVYTIGGGVFNSNGGTVSGNTPDQTIITQ